MCHADEDEGGADDTGAEAAERGSSCLDSVAGDKADRVASEEGNPSHEEREEARDRRERESVSGFEGRDTISKGLSEDVVICRHVVEGRDTLSEGLSQDVIVSKVLLDEDFGGEVKTIVGGVKSSTFFESRQTCFRQLDVMSGDVFSSVEDIKMSLHLGEIGDDVLLEVAEVVDLYLDAILDGERSLITILFAAAKVDEALLEAVDVRVEVADSGVDGL